MTDSRSSAPGKGSSAFSTRSNAGKRPQPPSAGSRGKGSGAPAARSSREAFVTATGRLLRRQGYAATGLNEIVAVSGAPKGSLYFHFPGGKEELAVAAMELAGDQFRGAIVAIVDSAEDLGGALATLVDALSAGLEASDFQDGCPIATITLEAASGSQAVRDAAADAFGSWLQPLERRLLADGLGVEAAQRRALLVLASIEGALILARARRDITPLNAVRDELVAICRGGRAEPAVGSGAETRSSRRAPSGQRSAADL